MENDAQMLVGGRLTRGYLKERIEGPVLAYQYCLVARNSLKELKHTSIVQNNDSMRNEGAWALMFEDPHVFSKH